MIVVKITLGKMSGRRQLQSVACQGRSLRKTVGINLLRSDLPWQVANHSWWESNAAWEFAHRETKATSCYWTDVKLHSINPFVEITWFQYFSSTLISCVTTALSSTINKWIANNEAVSVKKIHFNEYSVRCFRQVSNSSCFDDLLPKICNFAWTSP